MAGMPNLRIRTDATRNVWAEDFYGLLCEQDAARETVRPRGWTLRATSATTTGVKLLLQSHSQVRSNLGLTSGAGS